MVFESDAWVIYTSTRLHGAGDRGKRRDDDSGGTVGEKGGRDSPESVDADIRGMKCNVDGEGDRWMGNLEPSREERRVHDKKRRTAQSKNTA